ncbi:MAG: OB-fold nucleic acid binding domain-containing protein, partial [Candidatus Heimdallarchaeota archaeon]
MEKELDQVRIRKEKVQKLREMGIDTFPYIFIRTHFSEEVKENFDSLEEKEVVVAGRLVSRRLHGKAGFVHIEDDRGRIQIYFKYDTLQDRYALVKLLDLGDFIGVRGKVFRTKTGEVTVWAENVEVLSKALHPPPEKYHGLKDIELRYRNRHLDLMANPEVRDRFRMRTRIIQG